MDDKEKLVRDAAEIACKLGDLIEAQLIKHTVNDASVAVIAMAMFVSSIMDTLPSLHRNQPQALAYFNFHVAMLLHCPNTQALHDAIDDLNTLH